MVDTKQAAELRKESTAAAPAAARSAIVLLGLTKENIPRL